MRLNGRNGWTSQCARTLHVGGCLEGDRLCAVEPETIRKLILHGAGEGEEGDEMKRISADPAKTQHDDRAVRFLCVHGSECTVAHDERPHFLQKT